MSLLAIDGPNLAVTCAEATRDSHPEDPVGAALHRTVSMIARHVRELQPERVVVAFDLPPPWRTLEWDGYKATRTEDKSRNLVVNAVRDLLGVLGVPVRSAQSFEADDLLAWWAHHRGLRERVWLLTGDKDMWQCVTVSQRNPRPEGVLVVRPDGTVVDRQHVQAKFGVAPRDLAMTRALVGDASDGIGGVPKVGVKRAVTVLEESEGQWESVLEHRLVRHHTEDANRALRMIDLRNGVRMLDDRPFRGEVPLFEPDREGAKALYERGLVELAMRHERGRLWA